MEVEKQKGSYLLDTGASCTIIHTDDPFDSPLSTKVPFTLAGFTGKEQAGTFSLPLSIRLGTLRLKWKCILMAWQKGGGRGILGSDLLAGHGILVDLRNHCLWGAKGEKGEVMVIQGEEETGVLCTVQPSGGYDLRLMVADVPTDMQTYVTDNMHAFATHKHDCGRVVGFEVSVDGDPMTRPQKQYNFPKEAEPDMETAMSSLVQQGVLRPIATHVNSPLWPVRKPDNSWRATVDYRVLNSNIPACAPTVAAVADLIGSIPASATTFTVLDISNGFWSIPLRREDQYKFAFTFKGQQYTWNCLPQGFHNSPSIFHQCMAGSLKEFSQPNQIVQYVDDLLLFTDSREEHGPLLDELLELLARKGFKVNPKKARIGQQEVKFLGLTLRAGERAIDKARRESVQELPIPNNVRGVRSFLGLTGYCRDFIEDYAATAAPLLRLLHKGVEWFWDEGCQAAFEKLKRDLQTAPALGAIDGGKEFFLEVAASGDSLSAVLLQERHGKLRPVVYSSRVLTDVERSFSNCERHLLATHWAVKRSAIFTGLSPITLLTHHTPTKMLLDGRIKDGTVSSARIARWTLLLSQLDLRVKGLCEPRLAANLVYPGTAHRCSVEGVWDVNIGLRAGIHPTGREIYVDGSSTVSAGERLTGCGVYDPAADLALAIKLPSTMSAQQAELSAVVYVVTHPDIFPTPYTICSDSMFTCNSCTEYLAIWSRRGYTSADGRPLTVKPLLEKILAAAVGEEGEIFIHKVKAHSSTEPRGEGNRQADALAREGARDGTFWNPYRTGPIAAVRGGDGNTGNTRVALPLDLKTVQAQDPALKAVLKTIAEGRQVEGPYSTATLSVKEGMLFREEQWVVPQQHRREFLQLAHEGPGAGHPGPEVTWQRVEQAGWWPGLREQVREFCANCLVCAANNPDPQKRKVPMGHVRRVEGPWQSIQIDYIGPLPTTQGGYKYCLVLVDVFSKWVEAFPCRTATALGTAKILVREVFSRWGLPRFVESDQGSHFTGQVMQNTLMLLGIEGKWHVAHNPQSSGIVERMNRTLKEKLRKETRNSPQKWAEVLPLVLMGVRASQSKSTGYSPHEVMTGRLMRSPTHVLAPVLTEGQLQEISRDKFAQTLLERLKQVYEQAAGNMGRQHQGNRLLLEPRKTREWEVGDQVMVRNYARVGSLEPLYMGPYNIVDKASPMVYAVKVPRRTKWFHINQCKLYQPGAQGKTTGVNPANGKTQPQVGPQGTQAGVAACIRGRDIPDDHAAFFWSWGLDDEDPRVPWSDEDSADEHSDDDGWFQRNGLEGLGPLGRDPYGVDTQAAGPDSRRKELEEAGPAAMWFPEVWPPALNVQSSGEAEFASEGPPAGPSRAGPRTASPEVREAESAEAGLAPVMEPQVIPLKVSGPGPSVTEPPPIAVPRRSSRAPQPRKTWSGPQAAPGRKFQVKITRVETGHIEAVTGCGRSEERVSAATGCGRSEGRVSALPPSGRARSSLLRI